MSRLPTGKNLVALVLLALLVIVHVAVVASVLGGERSVIWPLHNDTVHRGGPASDFFAVYHAGVATGRGIDPYAHVADGVTPYWYPFRYLPAVGFLARPLTLLGPWQAFVAWGVLLEVLLAVLLVVLWRKIPEWWVRVTTIGLLLVSTPFFLELHVGQFTFASVTLCCLALLLPGGVAYYTLGVLLKPLVLAIVPALLRDRRYLWHAVVAVGVLVLATVPYFLKHPDRWQLFYQANFALEGGLDAGNYGLVRLLRLAVWDLDIEPVLNHWDAVIGVLRNLVLAATALLVLSSRRQAVMVGVAALLLAHFITYQRVWEHHVSAVAVLAAMLLTVPDWSRTTTLVILGSLLLLVIPTPFVWMDTARNPQVWDPSLEWPRWWSYLLVLVKVVPTVTLFAVVVRELVRAGLRSPRAVVAEWNRPLDGGS